MRGNTIPIIGHIHKKPGGDILTDGSVDPFGHLDSIYSETPRRAAANTLTFCLGMLITYYAVAALSHGVYDKIYVLFFVDVQRGTAAGVLRKQVWTTTGRAPMSE